MMRVTLINPNHHFQGDLTTKMVLLPLGLAYLAACLEKAGVKVSIIDANLENLTAIQATHKALAKKPDLIGLGAVTNTINEAWNIAQLIKKKSSVPIVLGGIHVTILPEESLQKNFIDMVIRGEGEKALVNLALGKNKTEVAGLSFKQGKKIIHNPIEPNSDLDTLPFPARHLLALEKYNTIGAKHTPYTTLISSRGCPYNCSFCSTRAITGQKFRPRSAENILEEIDLLVQNYGIREINILDDNFTIDPIRVEKICRLLIERDYDLILKNGNGVRIDRLTYPLLKLMKKAGWYFLAFGIESGNQSILNKNSKGLQLSKVGKVIKWCKKIGFQTEGFFIIGLPGETSVTINRTIAFAKKLPLDEAQFNILTPFAGTLARLLIQKEGRILTDDWSDYNAWSKPVFELKNLSSQQMLQKQKQAYRQFYLRPHILWQQIFKPNFWSKIKVGLPVIIPWRYK